MLSRRSVAALSRIIKFMTLTKAIPFSWNKNLQKLVPLVGNQQIPTICVFLELSAQTTFLVVNFILQRHNMSALNQCIHFFWLWAFCFCGTYEVYTLSHTRCFMNVINHFFELQQRLECYKIIEIQEPRNICETILRTYPYLCIIQSFVQILYFLANYTQPWYVYSLFGIPHISIAIIPFVVLEFIQCMYLFNYVCVIILPIMCYWFSMTSCLKEIRFGVESSNTIPIIRLPVLSLRLYKYFQLINQEFNEFFSNFYLPILQIIIMICPVIGYHTLIRYHSTLPIEIIFLVCNIDVLSVIFVGMVYPIAAQIHVASTDYIESLGRLKNRIVIRKQLASCCILKIKISSFFYIARFTSLRVINLIIYWTVKSLLSL